MNIRMHGSSLIETNRRISMEAEERRYHYVKAGDIKNPESVVRRVVHISDTHEGHLDLLEKGLVPDGDILVHSGDFTNYGILRKLFRERDFRDAMENIDGFFARLPHKYKMFVPGNHDLNIDGHPAEKVQQHLPNGYYIHDRPLTLDGIKFWGAGWNGLRSCSYARAFAIPWQELPAKWEKIPDDTDILVTHNPPFGVLDGRVSRKTPCDHTAHCDHGHMGCRSLRVHVTKRVKPKVHLFGHYHGANGVMSHNGVVFCNSAMECRNPMATVIDFYVAREKADDINIDTIPENKKSLKSSSARQCVIT